MSVLHTQSVETGPTVRVQAQPQDKEFEVDRGIVPTEKEVPTHEATGEIVVQCLEGQATITTSAQTQDIHAGELLYLPAGESPSVKGVEHASLLLSIEDLKLKEAEQNEMIHARGVLLSVMQAAVLVISLALLFVAVASNVFAGVLVVGAALVLFGCLHYWAWGRWMSHDVHPVRKGSH